jgi:hypothetical protein
MIFLLLFHIIGARCDVGTIAAWLVGLFRQHRYIDVAAVSPQQRLVRQPAEHRLRDDRVRRQLYSGLSYPLVVCLLTTVVGTFFLRETNGNKRRTDQSIISSASIAAHPQRTSSCWACAEHLRAGKRASPASRSVGEQLRLARRSGDGARDAAAPPSLQRHQGADDPRRSVTFSGCRDTSGC